MEQANQPAGRYSCSACGESFDSKFDLREHEKDCKQQADRATATPKK